MGELIDFRTGKCVARDAAELSNEDADEEEHFRKQLDELDPATVIPTGLEAYLQNLRVQAKIASGIDLSHTDERTLFEWQVMQEHFSEDVLFRIESSADDV